MSALQETYPHIVTGALGKVKKWGVQTGEQPNPFKHHLETYQAGDTTYEVFVGIRGASYQNNKDGTVRRLPTGVLEVTYYKDGNSQVHMKLFEMRLKFDEDGNLVDIGGLGVDDKNRDIGIRAWHENRDGKVFQATYVHYGTSGFEDFAQMHSVQVLGTDGEKTSYGRTKLEEAGLPPSLPLVVNWVDTLGRYLTGRDYIYDKPITGKDIMELPLV